MDCKSCGSTNVLAEGVGEGKVKVTCQACGECRVMDRQGRQLLTGETEIDRSRLLTEDASP